MRWKYILAAILFSSASAIAQQATIIDSGHFHPDGKSIKFAFLEPKTDTAGIQYVATLGITAEDRKKPVSNSFFQLKESAQQLGANCFRVRSSKRDSAQTTIVIDVYYASEAMLAANKANHAKNVVYLFCSDLLTNEQYSIKINNDRCEFTSGTYLMLPLNEDDELRLNKGGFTGSTLKLRYEENKPALFLSLTGFGVSGGYLAPPGSMGVAFNTGRLNNLDSNLGLFLTQVLKQGEAVKLIPSPYNN